MAFLVQMKQSNKSRSVRNDERINLHLGSGAGSSVSIPSLEQGISSIYWFYPPKESARKRTKNREMISNSLQIILLCLSLRTQNPGLREVDLEPSPMKGGDKINILKQGRNTVKKASHFSQPRLTYGSQHLER